MFEFKIKDLEGSKNQVANHLSRLQDKAMVILEDGAQIDVVFPYDQVLVVSYDLIPQIAYFANF